MPDDGHIDSDPMTVGGDEPFISRAPCAHGQPHRTVENAHHLSREDAAPRLVQIVIDERLSN